MMCNLYTQNLQKCLVLRVFQELMGLLRLKFVWKDSVKPLAVSQQLGIDVCQLRADPIEILYGMLIVIFCRPWRSLD